MPGLEKRALPEFTHTPPEKLYPRELNVRKKTSELTSYHETLMQKKGFIIPVIIELFKLVFHLAKKSFYRNMQHMICKTTRKDRKISVLKAIFSKLIERDWVTFQA